MSINHRYTSFAIAIFGLTFLGSLIIFFPLREQPTEPPVMVKSAQTSLPEAPVSSDIATPSVTAKAIYILDIASNTPLLEINSHDRLPPASLTKIMTALIATRIFDEDQVLTVQNGGSAVGHTAELLSHDRITAHDLLYALLIPSGNDAALTFAENATGGYTAFIQHMNSLVSELGLRDTLFSNVSGVTGVGDHYTSAHDIAIIARELIKNPLLASIVAMKKTTITSLNNHKYILESTNELLGEDGVLGVKTGWTPEAGDCLVTLVEREGHPVLISVLGSTDRFGETRRLINWLYANYLWQN